MSDIIEVGKTQTGKNWAVFCHISAWIGIIGIPLGNLLGPFVCWQLKKEEYSFVNDQGREALNFQLSMTLYLVIAAFMAFATFGLLMVVIIPLAFCWVLAKFFLVLFAALNASKGIKHRYPLTIRFLKVD